MKVNDDDEVIKVSSLRNMSSKSRRKCSPGILHKDCSDRETVQRDVNRRKLNIRVHDPSKPINPREVEAEERRFEELKRQYFSQCAPINRKVVRKCSRPFDCNDLDMNIFKTVRGNLKVSSNDKNRVTREKDEANRKKRSTGVNTEDTNVNRQSIRRGCGAMGCNCTNCICGLNCQIDCKCMRRI